MERKNISYYREPITRAEVLGVEGLTLLGQEAYVDVNSFGTMDPEKISLSFFFKPNCATTRCWFLDWSENICIYYQNGTFTADVYATKGRFGITLLQESNDPHNGEDEPDKSDKIRLIGMEPDKSDKIGLIGMELSVIGLSRNKDQSH